MFVFKNITIVKELEKNRTTQKMNKMAYYQVTHKLLTPINSILSMIQMLKEKLRNRSYEVQDFLEVCFYTTTQMLRTITQYIDFQKLEEGLIQPIIKPFDIIEWIKEITTFYSFEAKKKGLVFELDLSAIKKNRLTLVNDKYRLSQILYTLIGNALKFTNSGSIQIKVSEVSESE